MITSIHTVATPCHKNSAYFSCFRRSSFPDPFLLACLHHKHNNQRCLRSTVEILLRSLPKLKRIYRYSTLYGSVIPLLRLQTADCQDVCSRQAFDDVWLSTTYEHENKIHAHSSHTLLNAKFRLRNMHTLTRIHWIQPHSLIAQLWFGVAYMSLHTFLRLWNYFRKSNFIGAGTLKYCRIK